MNKRIANKVLKNDCHNGLYRSDGGDILSTAPYNYKRYCKACKALHRVPYYDQEWYNKIKGLIIRKK